MLAFLYRMYRVLAFLIFYIACQNQFCGSGFRIRIRICGSVSRSVNDIQNTTELNFLDNSFFCILHFCVRRFIDVLDSENQPGSGKIRTKSSSPDLPNLGLAMSGLRQILSLKKNLTYSNYIGDGMK